MVDLLALGPVVGEAAGLAGTETHALLQEIAGAMGAWTIPLCIAGILLYGALRGVKVYEVFVEGAKEGFEIGVRIIPYLVAILVVVGLFRGSGAMDGLASLLAPLLGPLGIPVEAIPMALIRPLSGGAAQGILADVLQHGAGPDSLAGRMLSVMSGSTETTFYVLALYLGSVGVRRPRHALPAALLADVAGLVTAVIVSLLFFT